MLNMNQVEINVMQPGTSDHSPSCLELDSNMRGSHKAFKIFNCIAAHPDFLPKVKEAWSGGYIRDLKEVWFKLKKVKANLKQLNNTEFIGVGNTVKDIRGKLQHIQEIMRDPSAVAQYRQHEKELQIQLEKWSMIEESAMQQKSRIQWLRLGDANTAYLCTHEE
ncbi:hypothetical protein KY289_026962 [Solanum tuberosum]|nr:hypothetical protein KY289_026962 [Solanum tuberosum]